MARKVLGSLSVVSHDSTKSAKMIAEVKIIFGKTVKDVIPNQGVIVE